MSRLRLAMRTTTTRTTPRARPGRTTIEEIFATLALENWLMLGYLAVASLLVFRAGASAQASRVGRELYVSAACVLVGAWCARSAKALPYGVRWVVYRLAIAGVLLESYLMLRDLLPLVRPDSVDEALFRLDVRLFGVEPSMWLQRFNTRPVIEWFSFFYFSYFAVCATYLVSVVWVARGGRQTAEFALGTLIVFCVGQLGYMAVPATGPIAHYATAFERPLDGGFFWSCVWSTVEAGGAQKDVFPSLHTAVPTWFTLFAFHRASIDPRWKWPARVTAFFAANIVVSTMLLRWHYAVDVLAGLTLAIAAGVLAPRIVKREAEWRRAMGFDQVWSLGSGAP